MVECLNGCRDCQRQEIRHGRPSKATSVTEEPQYAYYTISTLIKGRSSAFSLSFHMLSLNSGHRTSVALDRLSASGRCVSHCMSSCLCMVLSARVLYPRFRIDRSLIAAIVH